MSHCIRVAKFGDRWQFVAPEESDEELDGVRLVTEAPEFLGLLNPDQGMPRAAIVAPNSASGRVMLAVDEKGGIRIVVCPEKGGEAELAGLIGDVLATSGRFWHQPYKAIAEPFEKYLGVPLANWIGDRVGKGWTKDAFKTGVEQSLQAGRFPVTMLVRKPDKTIKDMLSYLSNMNLSVAILGYSYSRGNGVEMVRPIQIGEAEPSPASEPEPMVSESKSLGKLRPGEIPHGEQHTVVVPVSTGKRRKEPQKQSESFPADKASAEQQKILGVLVRLDEIGLTRRGLECFVPGDELKDGAEGTIVVCVDEDRWPFPKPDEVVVVVNTGQDFFAGYLSLTPEEIEEFLESLPRIQRKEHRGCVLLRASNIHEAEQLVNELRALREVAKTGV